MANRPRSAYIRTRRGGNDPLLFKMRDTGLILYAKSAAISETDYSPHTTNRSEISRDVFISLLESDSSNDFDINEVHCARCRYKLAKSATYTPRPSSCSEKFSVCKHCKELMKRTSQEREEDERIIKAKLQSRVRYQFARTTNIKPSPEITQQIRSWLVKLQEKLKNLLVDTEDVGVDSKNLRRILSDMHLEKYYNSGSYLQRGRREPNVKHFLDQFGRPSTSKRLPDMEKDERDVSIRRHLRSENAYSDIDFRERTKNRDESDDSSSKGDLNSDIVEPGRRKRKRNDMSARTEPEKSSNERNGKDKQGKTVKDRPEKEFQSTKMEKEEKDKIDTGVKDKTEKTRKDKIENAEQPIKEKVEKTMKAEHPNSGKSEKGKEKMEKEKPGKSTTDKSDTGKTEISEKGREKMEKEKPGNTTTEKSDTGKTGISEKGKEKMEKEKPGKSTTEKSDTGKTGISEKGKEKMEKEKPGKSTTDKSDTGKTEISEKGREKMGKEKPGKSTTEKTDTGKTGISEKGKEKMEKEKPGKSTTEKSDTGKTEISEKGVKKEKGSAQSKNYVTQETKKKTENEPEKETTKFGKIFADGATLFATMKQAKTEVVKKLQKKGEQKQEKKIKPKKQKKKIIPTKTAISLNEIPPHHITPDRLTKLVKGQKLTTTELPLVKSYEKITAAQPMLFKATLTREEEKDELILPDVPTANKRSEKVTTDKKNVQPKIGITQYALSDRRYIDKGWTVLPSVKIVRKINVYKMRPSHPEFDWFKRNKHKQFLTYDSGEMLAQFHDNGRACIFYRNGKKALEYYDAEEVNAQKRYMVYSNGLPDERGRPRSHTVLASFDYLGNGIVYDHAGEIRLKYNQTEGVVLDKTTGPVSSWKWHALNDPPVLQQLLVDSYLEEKDQRILKLGPLDENKPRPDDEEMLAIEFDNYNKEKSKKLNQTFKPYQIRAKVLKINENFSLKILDQAYVILTFRDGRTNIKLNLGMILDHHEIIDTETADVGDVANSFTRIPARSDSLEILHKTVAHARKAEKMRNVREDRLRPVIGTLSSEQMTAAASKPRRRPLMSLPEFDGLPCPRNCLIECQSKPSNPCVDNIYYDTRIF